MSDKVRETKPTVNELKDEYLRMIEESFEDTAGIKKGDVVESPIVAIDDKHIIVNLGGKFDAFANIGEYADENGELELKVGDILRGYIVDENPEGFVVGKSLTKQYVDKQSILDAYERQIPVAGKIYSLTKGGFNVDILGARAFCPASQIALRPSGEHVGYIGKTMDFIVIECSENCRRIVVSHRQIEEAEAKEKREAALAKLSVGSEVKGKVMRMTNFGAFMDIGGVEGLMHISEMSWQHVVKPQDILKVGQEVDMKILDIKNDKIALSMKALMDNPFEAAMKDMKEGDVVNCRILRLHNFGAFAELKPGVEGLIPISEMSRSRNISHPRDVVKEGDYVQVQILRIDPDTQKISLSLKALQEDPWDTIDEKITLNEPFEGVVENTTNFGVFVTISEGLTGLLPRSRVRRGDEFQSGETIELMVTAIDKDSHRITLDYTDRTPEELAEVQRRDESQFRERDRERDSRPPRRGPRQRQDEEWRRYANQKVTVVDDNPFKNL